MVMTTEEYTDKLDAISRARTAALEALPQQLTPDEFIRQTDEVFRVYHAQLFELLDERKKVQPVTIGDLRRALDDNPGCVAPHTLVQIDQAAVELRALALHNCANTGKTEAMMTYLQESKP